MKLFDAIAEDKKVSGKELRGNPASTLVCAEIDAHCRRDVAHTRCITDEEMALFLEGHSSHPAYEGIISHIASCSRCASLTRETFRAFEQKPVHAPKGIMERSFYIALARKKPTLQSILSAAFFFTAIAALIFTAVATILLALR
jgi:hypothetical protein